MTPIKRNVISRAFFHEITQLKKYFFVCSVSMKITHFSYTTANMVRYAVNTALSLLLIIKKLSFYLLTYFTNKRYYSNNTYFNLGKLEICNKKTSILSLYHNMNKKLST